ncbi:ATP-NAD kinase [Polychaeton citri CBS 116435]|uniref:ATP-NAD kinase n=1 Tax=Polychaeton citri CBS 116435 TaxID=1314669 RepID=A0A9P4QFG7_9PEZI|nr:ATP-NAD kinase [Polychaeton citri CBS 116435]
MSSPVDRRKSGFSNGESETVVDANDQEVIQEQLEVIFDNANPQRRRASLVEPKIPSHRPDNGDRRDTSCFVHNLIEQRAIDRETGYFPSPEGLTAHKPADKAIAALQDAYGHNGESHRQSRLLTKKQLSDMALNIRELSKKLGHIRLMLKIRNIFLLTKAHDQKLIVLTRQLTAWLLKQHGQDGHSYTIWVEDTMKENPLFNAKGLIEQDLESNANRIKYWDQELCRKKPHQFEICIALGGDGTVLYASWLFQRVVPPVMSFALGSLGFLTKFDFDNHEQILTTAINDGITVSLRLRFEATIMRSKPKPTEAEEAARDLVEELVGDFADDPTTHHPEGSHNVLNEVILDRGPSPSMTTIEVFGDEEHFTTVQADGLCAATPTGSTAYNLAGGGSLCHPDNPVILLTAIAPHTLSFRPIILPDTIVLRLGVPYDARASAWASFDGKERCELRPGDYATISASRYPFPSVLPLNRRSEDWVDSISRTLNWNNRQRQKAFDDQKKNAGKK